MKCGECRREVRSDSVFCRFCGHRLEGSRPDHESELLARTRLSINPKGAAKACEQYLNAYGAQPAANHVRLCRYAYFTPRAIVELARQTRGPHQFDAMSLAEQFSGRLASVLANGTHVQLRIAGRNAREQARTTLTGYRSMAAAGLQPLFDEARREATSLLDGEVTGAMKEGLTQEEVGREAHSYYQAFREGDLDLALKGFGRLKGLNPKDGYFRNMIGAVYEQRGRHLDALREYIYAAYLEPCHNDIYSNLVRQLANLLLFPAVLEVSMHYRTHAGENDNRVIPMLDVFARSCMGVLVNEACAPDDYAPDAADLLEELEPIARPWLRVPDKNQEPSVFANSRIFLSYRRGDTLPFAVRLENRLERDCPGLKVFRDKSDGIGGTDWVERIKTEIESASVVLVLIGKKWQSKRLDDRTDVLRREIAYSLRREKPLIPILVDGATMPAAEALPNEIRRLAALQAAFFERKRFDTDYDRFIFDLSEKLKLGLARDEVLREELETLLNVAGEEGDIDLKERWGKALDQLPKHIVAHATGNEGVRNYVLDGCWEVKATLPAGPLGLRLEVTNGEFEGQLDSGGSGRTAANQRPISGSCYAVLDPDKQVFLGLHLDGLVAGVEPFQLRIPVDRRVGPYLLAEDSEGGHWSSRNIAPREHGL